MDQKDFWIALLQKCAMLSADVREFFNFITSTVQNNTFKIFLKSSALLDELHKQFCVLLTEKRTDMEFKVKLLTLLALFCHDFSNDNNLRFQRPYIRH